ncbi:hypothetical protein [Streptomyces sp. KLOTTS4A1]
MSSNRAPRASQAFRSYVRDPRNEPRIIGFTLVLILLFLGYFAIRVLTI